MTGQVDIYNASQPDTFLTISRSTRVEHTDRGWRFRGKASFPLPRVNFVKLFCDPLPGALLPLIHPERRRHESCLES
jgi:hypothetical protein